MNVRKQGPWGLWWLTIITFGVYWFVWYSRINRELAGVLQREVPADGKWWSQLIPVYNIIGVSRTAKRLNEAHKSLGSSTRVSPVVAWLWSALWFGSTNRYLQRRINILVDVESAGRFVNQDAGTERLPTG